MLANKENDDFGKDELNGLVEGFDEKAGTMIVARASYEVTDPEVVPPAVSGTPN